MQYGANKRFWLRYMLSFAIIRRLGFTLSLVHYKSQLQTWVHPHRCKNKTFQKRNDSLMCVIYTCSGLGAHNIFFRILYPFFSSILSLFWLFMSCYDTMYFKNIFFYISERLLYVFLILCSSSLDSLTNKTCTYPKSAVLQSVSCFWMRPFWHNVSITVNFKCLCHKKKKKRKNIQLISS